MDMTKAYSLLLTTCFFVLYIHILILMLLILILILLILILILLILNWTLCCYKIAMLNEDDVWHDLLSFDDIDDSVLCFTTVLKGLLDF